MIIDEDGYLEHHGVKGMKWGVRHDPGKTGFGKPSQPIKKKASQTEITKQVIDDHNKMTGVEFFKKYAITKKTYAKRVEKHGDPYQHRINEIKKQRGITDGPKKKSAKKKKLSENQKDLLKFAGVSTAAIAVGILAAIGDKKYKNMKAHQYADRREQSNREATTRLYDALKEIKLRDINKAYDKGHITVDQGYRLSTLNDRNTANRIKRATLQREAQRPHKQTNMTPRQALIREKARRR